MFYKNIQKYALKFNKNKYLKSMGIPLFFILILTFYCFSPFLMKFVFNTVVPTIPDEYKLLFTALRCILILLSGFSACIFYCSFSVGEEAWYSGRLTKKKNCFKRFIYWLRPKNSFKAFRLRAALFFLKLFWTLVFLLPSVLSFSVIFVTAFSGGIETYLLLSLGLGTGILLITGLIFRFIMIQRYFLAEFILADKPQNGVLQTIRQSKNLIDGQIFKIVKFKLFFLPYALPCLLLLPIFFVYPHYKQSRSILAKELMV